MTQSRNTLKTKEVNKSFKLRAYPSKNQIDMIFQTFGSNRFQWNQLLSIENFKYSKLNGLKYIGGCGISPPKRYETLIKDVYLFLKEVEASSLQQTRRDLEKAFKNFFRRVRNGENPGYPKFKSKHNPKQAYRTINNKVDFENNKAYFPKIGWIKFKHSFKFPKTMKILSKTLKFENNRFYIVLTCSKVPVTELPKTGKSVGIDLGLKDSINCDNGKKSGKLQSKRLDSRVKRLNKRLSNQVKGSNRWFKTKAKLNNAYYHKKLKLLDRIHWLTTKIVRNNDEIIVGDVNSKLGLKNKRLAKTTSDAHWFEIKRQLEYKSGWYGKEFKVVNEFYTSKTCSECGFENEKMNLSVRYWTCPNCGTNHDRDTNAAKNICTVGRTGVKNIKEYFDSVFKNARGKKNTIVLGTRSPLL